VIIFILFPLYFSLSCVCVCVCVCQYELWAFCFPNSLPEFTDTKTSETNPLCSSSLWGLSLRVCVCVLHIKHHITVSLCVNFVCLFVCLCVSVLVVRGIQQLSNSLSLFISLSLCLLPPQNIEVYDPVFSPIIFFGQLKVLVLVIFCIYLIFSKYHVLTQIYFNNRYSMHFSRNYFHWWINPHFVL